MARKTTKNPWFKFRPDLWRGEPTLGAVSVAARGLWIEMLCLMHEAEPRGHLLLNGHPMTDSQLASLARVPVEIAQALLGELETAGTFSRTRAGVIYSRRMRNDTIRSAKQRANVSERWEKSDGTPHPQPSEKTKKKRVRNTKPHTKTIPKSREVRTRTDDPNGSISSSSASVAARHEGATPPAYVIEKPPKEQRDAEAEQALAAFGLKRIAAA